MGQFKPGQSGNPNGRPAGSKNIKTQQIREAYQKLTEDNLTNMQQWLERIAEDSPEKAMQLMINLSDFVIPKLSRTELTDGEGDNIFKHVSFKFGPDINDTEGRVDE